MDKSISFSSSFSEDFDVDFLLGFDRPPTSVFSDNAKTGATDATAGVSIQALQKTLIRSGSKRTGEDVLDKIDEVPKKRRRIQSKLSPSHLFKNWRKVNRLAAQVSAILPQSSIKSDLFVSVMKANAINALCETLEAARSFLAICGVHPFKNDYTDLLARVLRSIISVRGNRPVSLAELVAILDEVLKEVQTFMRPSLCSSNAAVVELLVTTVLKLEECATHLQGIVVVAGK